VWGWSWSHTESHTRPIIAGWMAACSGRDLGGLPHPGHHPPMLSLGVVKPSTNARFVCVLGRSANYANAKLVRSHVDSQRSWRHWGDFGRFSCLARSAMGPQSGR
jgi:hypothetical protein